MNNRERMVGESEAFAGHVQRYVGYLTSLLQSLDVAALEKFAGVLERAPQSGQTVFLAGNGGSAATASHWANDLTFGTPGVGGCAVRAICLTDNVPALTALANDHRYSEIFVRQLRALFRPGDVLVAISASGNSPNVVHAVEYANAHGGITVGLLGFDGGRLKTLCQLPILVATPQGEYGPVEDIHLMLDHMMMTWLKQRFGLKGRT